MRFRKDKGKPQMSTAYDERLGIILKSEVPACYDDKRSEFQLQTTLEHVSLSSQLTKIAVDLRFAVDGRAPLCFIDQGKPTDSYQLLGLPLRSSAPGRPGSQTIRSELKPRPAALKSADLDTELKASVPGLPSWQLQTSVNCRVT